MPVCSQRSLGSWLCQRHFRGTVVIQTNKNLPIPARRTCPSQGGNYSFHPNQCSLSVRRHLAMKAHKTAQHSWILSSHPTYNQPQIILGKYWPQLSFSVSCWTTCKQYLHILLTDNPHRESSFSQQINPSIWSIFWKNGDRTAWKHRRAYFSNGNTKSSSKRQQVFGMSCS